MTDLKTFLEDALTEIDLPDNVDRAAWFAEPSLAALSERMDNVNFWYGYLRGMADSQGTTVVRLLTAHGLLTSKEDQ